MVEKYGVCHYCDLPLDYQSPYGIGGVSNGFHDACEHEFRKEWDEFNLKCEGQNGTAGQDAGYSVPDVRSTV